MAEPQEKPLPPFVTHEVFNQPPPLENYNLFRTDRALAQAVEREGAAWAVDGLMAAGEEYGRAETIEWGLLANQNPPRLHTFDRFGRRRDEVEFHPSYHAMMELAVRHGLHAAPWGEPRAGAHVARAAGVIMAVQIEAGVQCPITMTYGVVPALRRQPDLAAELEPKLFSRRYDRRFRPVAEKHGMTMGMGMTEKQGGSDLRTNTTRAMPAGAGGPGAEYRIVGHKWFFSAPMCDAFLVLANAPGGLSCFYLPRFTPDGELNAIRIQRLKPKLGNWSNASSEVEFHGAYARLVGEEGRGIPNIIEMATYTRLDCALGTTGLMRQAVAQALHHAAHRSAFQRRLVDQPLMTNVLADLALEQEAATALVMRLARAFDRQGDEKETLFRRLMTPAVKFWICKRGPALGPEAMEVLGGAGYVEESMMPRLYRELPLNSIWEGSGNVMCLDVLRAMQREPAALEVFMAELRQSSGGDRRLDRAIDALESEFFNPTAIETRARRLVERMALLTQASLLLRHAPGVVADAFIASRLDASWSGAFGTLPSGLDLRAIVERAMPA
ncbi:MAG: isovaleryl-CoA dehydrogenase [Alphaproteobacteria bacterium]|nr:isovaleryl-CoA dehydrogenase [Alphaproteobacteria bacterium]